MFLFAFLPVVLLLWYGFPVSLRTRLVGLTLASYVFYGWWDWRFTSLMLLSTLVDYLAGARIHASEDEGARRRWLMASLAMNLGLLGIFKYLGFFAESVNGVLAWAGAGARFPVLEVVLPVGISFYTFQSMSYTIDIFRGRARPTEGFWEFACYVSLFPQLVAGPIVRYTDMEEQLRSIRQRVDWANFRLGLQFLVLGLAKKLVIADSQGRWVDALLADAGSLGVLTSWLAITGYAMQIYFDFSGYSDMAVGLGKMLGFELPRNFDSPYKATDISDFWRRWHMTLSRWLRDYLYIPLGGSRGSTLFTLRNLVITMFLGGLWHGAEWTFVVWGLYHGLLLVGCQLWKQLERPLPAWPARLVTFTAVLVSWVLFRADDLPQALRILEAMVGLHGGGWHLLARYAEFLGDTLTALAICWFLPNTWELRPRDSAPWALAYACLAALSVTLLRRQSPFLYFQF